MSAYCDDVWRGLLAQDAKSCGEALRLLHLISHYKGQKPIAHLFRQRLIIRKRLKSDDKLDEEQMGRMDRCDLELDEISPLLWEDLPEFPGRDPARVRWHPSSESHPQYESACNLTERDDLLERTREGGYRAFYFEGFGTVQLTRDALQRAEDDWQRYRHAEDD